MRQPNITEIIQCPCSSNGKAFKDSFDEFEVQLCVTCGLMTTSKYMEGTEHMASIKKLSPPEIWDLSIVDSNEFRWFPSVLNGPKSSLAYAQPLSNGGYRWILTPIVSVSEAERFMYVNPENGTPYEYRLAEESSVVYDREEFVKVLEAVNSEDTNRLLERIKTIFN